MPDIKTPTTFRELEASCTPGRALSGPAAWSRRCAGQYGLSEAEAVTIALGVERTKGRFFTEAGQWTLVGSALADQHVQLMPGERPGPEDA